MKNKKFLKLFEEYDKELDSQFGAVSAGNDIPGLEDKPEDLAALGIEETPAPSEGESDGEAPVGGDEDGEVVYLEIKKDDLAKLKELIGKLIGSSDGTATNAKPEGETEEADGLEIPTDEPKVDEDEEVKVGSDEVEITAEDIAFLEKLMVELDIEGDKADVEDAGAEEIEEPAPVGGEEDDFAPVGGDEPPAPEADEQKPDLAGAIPPAL